MTHTEEKSPRWARIPLRNLRLGDTFTDRQAGQEFTVVSERCTTPDIVVENGKLRAGDRLICDVLILSYDLDNHQSRAELSLLTRELTVFNHDGSSTQQPYPETALTRFASTEWLKLWDVT
jgi:hypothetical protein